MTVPAPRPSDLAHELKNTITALLVGIGRLRQLAGGPERDRALALLDRMEAAARGMGALAEAIALGREPADKT